jgi:hypothetical protein
LTQAERPIAIAAKIEGKPHEIVGRLSATPRAVRGKGRRRSSTTPSRRASRAARQHRAAVLKSKAKEMEKQFIGNLRAGFVSAEQSP